MFRKQRLNYAAYESIESQKLNHHAELATNKFSLQEEKGKRLASIQHHEVEKHRYDAEERLVKAKEGHKRHLSEKQEFLEREKKRKTDKNNLREEILFSISVD